VIKGIETSSVKETLTRATAEAMELGLEGIPAVAVGDQLCWGDDGLGAGCTRPQAEAAGRQAGREAMGLARPAQPGYLRPQLAAVRVPEGIADARVRADLLRIFNLEIGAGLGVFRGKVWRIGLMGESSRRENVMLVLNALETVLAAQGTEIARGAALAAADNSYNGAP